MYRIIFYILLIIPFTISCVQEEVVIKKEISPEDKEVMFQLDMPSRPASYAITDDQEIVINTIDVLAFKIEGGEEKYAYTRAGKVSPGTGFNRSLTVTLKGDNNSYRYVLLVNAHTEYTSLPGTPSEGMLKEDLLPAILSKIEDKWLADGSSNYRPLTMWGETDIISDLENFVPSQHKVRLLRSVAAVDIYSEVDILNFKLQKVYIYNRHIYGRVVPEPGRPDEGGPPSLPAAPLKIQYPTKVQNGYPKVDPYDRVTTDISGTKLRMLNEIYLHEADIPTPDTDFLDATCLIIGGIYDNKESKGTRWYRVDFLYGEDKRGKGYYMGGIPSGILYSPVLRNTEYRMYINEVKGDGYDNPDDAFEKKDKEKDGNMKVIIVGWTDGNLPPHITGKYYLRVDRSEFINTQAGFQGEIRVSTDYPISIDGGWNYKAKNMDENTDISFNKNGNVLTFTLINDVSRGIIEIKAGNLTKEILINP